MFVWCSLAADLASRSKRRLAWASTIMLLGKTLSATWRPSETCSAS